MQGMSASYIPYHPEQQQLLPNALQDWLPQGHLAYFINDTVDSLNLSGFHLRYATGGPRNQPFHPAMMVKVLVYAYASGVFSSRKIARKLFEDVAFRVLAADNFPAHRTIREFRALHLSEFTDLFVQVVRLAREMGLVKLGTIAVDGTKIKANASRHKAMSYGRMQTTELELKAQIAALMQKAANTDEAEKNEPELDIPASLNADKSGWPLLPQPKPAWKNASAKATHNVGAAQTTNANPKTKTASPRAANRISVTLVFLQPKLRTALPTPNHAS